MLKRKDFAKSEKHFEDESSSDEDMDMLDVDFEFFDPQPNVDFHSLRTLLRQLLDIDGPLLDLSALVELILSQPLLGSTVKVDGNETDPYAFLTVLNLHEHRELPAIQATTEYLRSRAATTESLRAVEDLLRPGNTAEIGLLLTERLVNIPAEVAPPMYKMLLEEIQWALEEKEPYTFSHYLVISKTYLEVASMLDQEGDGPQKKKKKAAKKAGNEVFYFHPEDEVLHKHAEAHGNFAYVREEGDGQADAKRTFQELGIKPQGHMILIEASKFAAAVSDLENFMRSA